LEKNGAIEMNGLSKMLVLITTLYNSQTLANPVFFVFKHVPAKTGEPGAGVATLSIRADCFPFHSAWGARIPLNAFKQDHMTDSKSIPGYSLIVRCHMGNIMTEIDTSEDIDKPGAYREIDITASCPVDEHGKLQQPSDISISYIK
jgi:hypothetical protein